MHSTVNGHPNLITNSWVFNAKGQEAVEFLHRFLEILARFRFPGYWQDSLVGAVLLPLIAYPNEEVSTTEEAPRRRQILLIGPVSDPVSDMAMLVDDAVTRHLPDMGRKPIVI
jgi:hypothetical protein